MPQFFFLGVEIFRRCGVGFDFAGDALYDFDTRGFKSGDFLRIVGEQANTFHSEKFQDFSGKLEFTMVGLEPKIFVGLYGVATLVLEFVSLKLGHEADTPAFLLVIYKDASAGTGDHGKGHFQLLAAVTAHRAENVAGETLRVDTNQRRFGVDVTHDQGDSFLKAPVATEETFEAHDTEMSPAGGEIGLSHFAKGGIRTHVIYYRHQPLDNRGRVQDARF
jgi:hypothetical protein